MLRRLVTMVPISFMSSRQPCQGLGLWISMPPPDGQLLWNLSIPDWDTVASGSNSIFAFTLESGPGRSRL